MPGPYTIGDTVTLEVILTDPDTGLPVDASDIACRVHPPTGSDSTPIVTKYAAGRYRALFASSLAGEHWYAFSSATLQMRREGAFVINERHVA